MARKRLRIFVASTSAYVEKNDDGTINEEHSRTGKLKAIIDALDSAELEPIPWWDSKNVMIHGDSFLTNMIRASKIFDGGVFVFGDEPDIDGHNKNDVNNVLNSNVLLEMGMFYASKGKKRTFCVIDKESNFSISSLPTDVSGYHVENITDHNLKEKISDFYSESSNQYDYDTVTFYIGSGISRKILNREYVKWQSKALYIGTESANMWDKIEGDDTYEINIDAIHNFLQTAIDNCAVDLRSIDNIISFGCGNGNTDYALITKVKEINDAICYVPVDINAAMAFKSASYNSETVRIPFAIIDDFEKHNEHIKRIISGKVHEIGEDNLFAMLGVTFSNLEDRESSVLGKIKGWMGKNDYFIVDISLGSDDNEEFSNQLHNTLTKNVTYRNLLLNSIIKKHFYLDGNGIDDIDFGAGFVDELRTNFKDYIRIDDITGTRAAQKHTGVSGTSVFKCNFVMGDNSSTMLISKRYDYNNVKKAIKRSGFSIVHEEDADSQDMRKKAIFLLKLDQ